MKRKIIAAFIMVLMVSNISYASSNLFKDTKSGDWFTKDVSYLVKLKGISGYPDGTFKPSKKINKSEFVKTLVSSLGYNNLKASGKHWASGYMDKAYDLGLISKDNMKNIDKAITRYEMAEIISNTLAFKKESIPIGIDKYSSQIKDLNKIKDRNLHNAVLNTYVKGIISGYPDGTFSGERSLSRAEASSVIVRLIDSSSRTGQNLKPKDTTFAKEVLNLVNIERKKNNLNSLKFSDNLNSIADLKSKDMATNKYFDHNSPNYGSLFDMLKSRRIDYSAAGENIAMGQTTPKQVVDDWMKSPGHRKNILNPNFNKMGLGVYSANSTYWTQAFTN